MTDKHIVRAVKAALNTNTKQNIVLMFSKLDTRQSLTVAHPTIPLAARYLSLIGEVIGSRAFLHFYMISGSPNPSSGGDGVTPPHTPVPLDAFGISPQL